MLTNKVALVTGSSRGIGKAIALKLASYGADMVITYFSSAERAAEVKRKVEEYGSKAMLLQFDVSDEPSVKNVMNAIGEGYGRLDILVNNAGEAGPIAFEKMSIQEWNHTMNLNLTGAFLCIKHAIPLLKKSGDGRIINISSVAGLTGGSFGPHYGASKAGVIGLTKSAARELAKYNIAVNAIAPGPIESEMTDSLDKSVVQQIIDATPMRRLGRRDEVAEMVCQLASPGIGYITGQTIVIDGGRYMI